jgi:hypothetical protein
MGKYSFHLLRKCSLTPLSAQRPPSGSMATTSPCPNQTSPPQLFAEPPSLPLPLPYCPTALRKHLWAVETHPYLAFCDKSPFQGELFGLLGGSVDAMHLDHTRFGWHLPHHTAKSWKQLEQTLRHIARRLRQWFRVAGPIFEPKFPSAYGYFSSHSTENAAVRGAILTYYTPPFVRVCIWSASVM